MTAAAADAAASAAHSWVVIASKAARRHLAAGGGETGRFLWANSHDIFVIGGRIGGVYEWWEWYRVDLG